MENCMLYCYKEWLEKRYGNTFKRIFKLPVAAIVLLALLFCGLIGFFVLLVYPDAGRNNSTATLVLSGVYVLLCMITSIYSEKYQVKHSKQSMKNYKKYCEDMMKDVLGQYGFSENFIPTLIERFNTIINEIDEKIKTKHEHFNKFFEMLLIPISAIILGALLDKSDNTNETLGLGLSGIIVILLIYAVAVFVLFLYDFVIRFPQGKYKEFVTDLQSILDFKECENTNDLDVNVNTLCTTEVTSENSAVHT
jgi:cytochrome bd-type quinol oxidase subunit 2